LQSNHNPPHTIANLPASDFAVGTTGTRDYLVTAGGNDAHTHSLSLTAAERMALGGGASVQTSTSTNSGHSHVVVITCL
jgi:hypothetical protein